MSVIEPEDFIDIHTELRQEGHRVLEELRADLAGVPIDENGRTEDEVEEELYLDRLGVGEAEEDEGWTIPGAPDWEDEGEDDTVFDNLLHPNGHTAINRTGQVLTLHNPNMNGEITINNADGEPAVITATVMNHPVVQQLESRVEHLEEQLERLIDVNQNMIDMLRESRQRSRTGEI